MIRTLAVVLLAAGLLTACGEPEQHVLELEATGTATLTSLTFTLDGKASEEKDVKLPWRKTVTVPGEPHEWELTMEHTGGDLLATATVDGQLLTQTAGSGSPGSNNTANLSGSIG